MCNVSVLYLSFLRLQQALQTLIGCAGWSPTPAGVGESHPCLTISEPAMECARPDVIAVRFCSTAKAMAELHSHKLPPKMTC